MLKSLDSTASVVGICMYLTISKFKQVLRSRKGLDDNTAIVTSVYMYMYNVCTIYYMYP